MKNLTKHSDRKSNRKGKALILLVGLIIIITLFSITLVSSSITWDNIAYWDMTNTSSTNIPDLTGNNHNITITKLNNVTMVNGLIGNAQKNSNLSHYMNITGNTTGLMGLNKSFSLLFWINVTDKHRYWETGGQQHSFFESGAITFVLQPNVSNGIPYFGLSGQTLSTNSWLNDSKFHQIGIVVNNTNVKYIVDGANAGIISVSSGLSGTTNPSFRPSIGDYNPYAFDEFGIWNRTLSDSEIVDLYNRGNGQNFSNLFYSIIYNKNVTEGSTETFSAMVNYNTTYYPNSVGYLIYNNTVYSSTKTANGGTTTFTSNIVIPLVTSTTSKLFYWSIGLINSTGTYYFNSSNWNQTVFNLAVDDCSSNTNNLMNFTLVDEDTQVKVTGISGNTLMKVSLSLYSVANGVKILDYANNFTKINPIGLCSPSNLGNSTLRLEALIEYSSDGRFIEFYNIQNYTLTNSTSNQNITLYNLNNTVGQEFKITYKDSGFSTVPGAIIQIQRQYIQEGAFKTIEIPKISSAGYTIGHLVRSDQVYNLVVMKDGIVLDSFENIVANCQNPSLQECEININSLSGAVSPNDFTNNNGFSSTLTYNKDTRTITSVFTIASGVSATTTLNATLFDALGNRTVCSNSLYSSGGTLSCVVPTSFGNSSIIIKISSGGVEKRFAILNIDAKPTDVYGFNIVFIGLIIFLLIIGMAITDNPMVLGIMLIGGIILLTVMNVITTSGWIGTGATILYLLIAIVLILIKGQNRQ